MIFTALEQLAESHAETEALVTPQRRWTYRQLHVAAAELADRWRALSRRRMAVESADVSRMMAELAAMENLGATTVLPRFADETFGANSQAIPDDVAEGGGIILFTSGTSGPPKPVVHTWQSLASAVHREGKVYAGRRWLLAYEPGSFAGLQVILQALLSGGTLVALESVSPPRVVECLRRENIEMISATPTFWRNVVCSVEVDALRRSCLRQITLGGEAADQPLLDALREAFPGARISQVYASTEMGVCFAVHDGLAGFPAAWVDDEHRTCRLKVAGDGELLIQSPRRMQRYAEGDRVKDGCWFATGDVVCRAGDRFIFGGRKSDAIHVGGRKVLPEDVERVIRTCSAVCNVRVYGIESSLTGQLVAAQVWRDEASDETLLRQEIVAACRRQLPKHMLPAAITFTVGEYAIGDKLNRQPVSLGR